MSSKLRNLKQQAYEAGRKRDWAGAAEAYAQILEQDKNNPSLQNEYGDVCLKMGDPTKAVRQYLSAASKYRQNGLLNNAQAVYKKVLRHEPGNLNANWYLAEIRSAQGLIAEGVRHALTFLAAAEEVSGEIKEIFLKRCLELFGLYPESDQVLERVEGIFRLWNMPLEAARAGCLRAVLKHRAGEAEEAAASVARLKTAVPELANYAEHTRWLEQTGVGRAPAAFADVNAIELDDEAADRSAAAPSAGRADEPPAGAGAQDVGAATAPQDDGPAADRTDAGGDPPESWSALMGDDRADAAPAEPPAVAASASPRPAEAFGIEKDDEGCISIDDDGETSFADLLDQVAGCVAEPRQDAEPVPDPAATASSSGGTVNLLDEILAEEGEDILRSSATEQVSTIASEIGRHLGESAETDPQSQYQQGLVYLEMGLHEQAVVAFAAAAKADTYRLRASEMWGIALHRSGQAEEALAVLLGGLAEEGADGRQALGLRYHAGRILEELGRHEEAQDHYRQVHALDAGFADVVQRLRVSVG